MLGLKDVADRLATRLGCVSLDVVLRPILEVIMAKDEFVEIHGEEVWQRRVAPLKALTCLCDMCQVCRCNANAIVHFNILAGRGEVHYKCRETTPRVEE
jgi:hypothetical protein